MTLAEFEQLLAGPARSSRGTSCRALRCTRWSASSTSRSLELRLSSGKTLTTRCDRCDHSERRHVRRRRLAERDGRTARSCMTRWWGSAPPPGRCGPWRSRSRWTWFLRSCWRAVLSWRRCTGASSGQLDAYETKRLRVGLFTTLPVRTSSRMACVRPQRRLHRLPGTRPARVRPHRASGRTGSRCRGCPCHGPVGRSPGTVRGR